MGSYSLQENEMSDNNSNFWVVNRMKRLGNGVDRSYGKKEPDDEYTIPLYTAEAPDGLEFSETQERIESVRYFVRMPKK